MSGYIGVQPVPQATQRREYFTATSGQTTFNTNGYTPGYIDVFMNGVKLSPSDFTATNGSDVVLASGATTGDLLQVISFTPFNVANQTFIGNVNLSSGGYQIGGTTVINSSRIGSLASLSVGTTNTSAQLVVGDDTDSTATLLQLRNDDSTYSQSWTFSSDTSKDLVITGASGSGGIKLSPGSRGVDVNSGPLKVGGTTVIDSSRNITAPNVTISSSNSNEFTFTRSATSKTTFGFGTANQSIASTGPLSIKPDGTTVNKYTFGSNDFVISGPNVAINNGSPELHFGTTSATHYNWRLAAQETLDAAFEIAVGSQDADYSDDTYSALVTVKNTGDVNITTGGLHVSSGTKTYRNEINNSSTAFSATGTLYINTALNGSGEGVLISSESRTTNDNDVSMFRLVDRAGATAFQVDVDGTGRFENTFYAGNDSTVAGDLRIFDTGNNQLQMAGVGSNSFRFDMVGTSSTGVLEVKDLVLSLNADLGNSGNSLIIGVNDTTTKRILFDEAPGSYSLGTYGGEVGYDGDNNFTFIGRNNNGGNSKVLRVARDNDAVTIGGSLNSSWNSHNYSLRTNNGIDINNQTGLYFQSGDAAIEEIGSGSNYGLKFTAYNATDSARRTKLTIEDSKDAPAVGYYRGQQTWYQGQGPWALRGAKWNRVAYIDHRRAYEIIIGTHGGWFGPGHICMHMSINYSGATFGLATISSYNNYVTQVRFTCNGNGSGGGYLDIYVTSSYDQNGPTFHIRPLDGGTYDFVDTQTLDPSTLTYTQTTNT